MLVSISDYRNIKQLSNLEIDDGKINFLTGMSGTGKTAIVKAIKGESDELDTRAGSEKTPMITCEPKPASIDVFDGQTVDDLYLEERSAIAYREKGAARGDAQTDCPNAFKPRLRPRAGACRSQP